MREVPEERLARRDESEACAPCPRKRGACRALRHPYDKRAYILPALALVCSLAAAVGAFAVAGALRLSVPADGLIPADDLAYAVEDALYDQHAGVVVAEALLEPDRDYTVAVVRSGVAPGFVEANGAALKRTSGRLGDLHQVSAFDLPGDSPDDVIIPGDTVGDSAPRAVTLAVSTPVWGGADAVYIGTHDAVYDAFYLLDRGMEVCALTMLSVMVVYALSLFLAKRSETYLIPFVAYMAFLIVWIALVGTDWFNRLSIPVLNYARICVHFYVAYIPSAICVLLAGIELPRFARPFVRWYGLLFIPALFAAVAYAVNFGAVMAVMVALCLVAAGWALVRGAALGHRGVIILIVGFGITMGCKLGATLVDVGLVDDCVFMYALRKARLLNVPVVISIMLYLNQTFARAFQRTEETKALLEVMVEQRTAGLVRQQNMRLGMMVNIFHDLRSPLFAIQRCVGALEAADNEERTAGLGEKDGVRGTAGAAGQAGPEGRIGLADRVKESGCRTQTLALLQERVEALGRLVDDLFTAAKLEDGECLLAEDPVDLESELRGVVDACLPLAGERGVTVELDLPSSAESEGQAGALMTWGDRRYVARAFQNLVDNAIRHAPEGTCVVVRAARKDGRIQDGPVAPVAPVAGSGTASGGPAVVVTVHNEGDPIEPEALTRVFERYYQRNTKAPDGSSGIGLSIVKSVVERHHGTVAVASDADAGTNFVVTLPLFQADGR